MEVAFEAGLNNYQANLVLLMSTNLYINNGNGFHDI